MSFYISRNQISLSLNTNKGPNKSVTNLTHSINSQTKLKKVEMTDYVVYSSKTIDIFLFVI